MAVSVEGAACRLPDGDSAGAASPRGGILSGGCCAGGAWEGAPIGRRGRMARSAAGAGFLVLAGAVASRHLPGRVALWPTALVPTWFGISHLVAGVTGYPGCPELGAIPSVILGRPVGTGCTAWERVDRLIEPGRADESLCGNHAMTAPGDAGGSGTMV